MEPPSSTPGTASRIERHMRRLRELRQAGSANDEEQQGLRKTSIRTRCLAVNR